MRTGNSRWDRFTTLLFLSVCAIVAFTLRAIPFRNYLTADGDYLFFGPDSYDHLRRIVLGIKAFPSLPPYDYYYGYPVGIGQVWAPLFDYLISLFALVIGLGNPGQSAIEAIGFWLPPVLSVLTVFVLYSAGIKLFGRKAALVAAAIIAILPAHILYSFVSRLDHHVAEPIICLAIMISVIKGMDSAEDGITGIGAPLATGLWMVFAILIWRGAVIFWGVIFFAILVHLLALRAGSENAQPAGDYAFRAHIFAALMLVPVCATNISGTAAGVTAGIVSWFHVVLLIACALILYAASRLSRTKVGIIVGMILLGGSVTLGVLPAGRRFLGEFVGGIEIITGSDPWLGAISELAPILYYEKGTLDLWYPVENFSLLYWIFPVIMLLLVRQWRKEGWKQFRHPLFIVWGSMFWLLPLFRLRYCHLAAVTVALGGGFLFSMIAARLSERRTVAANGIAAVFLVLLIVPVFSLLKTIPVTAPDRAVKYDLMVALRWLRDNTPQTSHFERPRNIPEYGVLADWGLGAHIVNVARRPALATNFGWETHGLFESAAFHSLCDPLAAEEILKQNRIRYILLNQVIGTPDDNRAIAAHAVEQRKFKTAATGTFHLQRSMYYRLLVKDAGAYEALGTSFPALGRYRLIYEAFNTTTYPGAGEVSLFKIFEYVPGAVLTGTAKEGSTVELELRLNSPIGRALVYRDKTVAGPHGRFSFRVPYPTIVASGILRPMGEYLLKADGRTSRAEVTEDDVYGKRVVAARQGWR